MTSKQATIFILLFLFQLSALAQEVHIRNISFEGNKRTREHTMLRELVFAPGDIIPADSVGLRTARSYERLMNLNLFNDVEFRARDFMKDSVFYLDIIITVKEKWYIWPIPTLESADRNFNIWIDSSFDVNRANYGIYLFNYNLFGRNQTLKTSIIGGYNTKLALEYRMPFISENSDLGLELSASYLSQDEFWARTEENRLQFFKSDDPNFIQNLSGSVTLLKRIQRATHVRLGTYYQGIQMNTEALQHSENYLHENRLEQQMIGLYSSLEHDTRDNIFLPRDGQYLHASVAYERIENLNNVKFTLVTQHFDQWSKRWGMAASFKYHYNTQSGLPYRYRRILGYDWNLRGFERYVADGTNGFLVNSALRFDLINNAIGTSFIPHSSYKKLPVRVFLEYFVDLGGAYSQRVEPINDFQNEVLYSTGLSVQTCFITIE